MVSLDKEALVTFAAENELSLVALFGSAARGDESRDIDLALFSESWRSRPLLELARSLSRLLGRGDLDLCWMPTASGLLWREVGRDALPLVESARRTLPQIRNEAARRFWDSRIWSMRRSEFVQRALEDELDFNSEMVVAELSELTAMLLKLEKVVGVGQEEFASSFLYHHTGERLLQLIVEAAAKVNHEIGMGAGTPATDYYNSFFVAAGENWISSDLARQLAELASLRNVLVHRYQQVSLVELYSELEASLPLWKEYVRSVQSRL